MSLRSFAKVLGRRGGLERARRLSARARSRIASAGGRARAESLSIAKRIEENFRYFEAIRQMTQSPPVCRSQYKRGKLPRIYG